VNAATRKGSSFASAAVVRHAPACVAPAANLKFLLSKKVRSEGAARSSGAILTIKRECGAGDTSSAPAKAAISPSVRPRDCRKKRGSLILLKSCPRRPGDHGQNLVPPLKRKTCVRSHTSPTPPTGVAQYFVIG